jgi:hypothetical protein
MGRRLAQLCLAKMVHFYFRVIQAVANPENYLSPTPAPALPRFHADVFCFRGSVTVHSLIKKKLRFSRIAAYPRQPHRPLQVLKLVSRSLIRAGLLQRQSNLEAGSAGHACDGKESAVHAHDTLRRVEA